MLDKPPAIVWLRFTVQQGQIHQVTEQSNKPEFNQAMVLLPGSQLLYQGGGYGQTMVVPPPSYFQNQYQGFQIGQNVLMPMHQQFQMNLHHAAVPPVQPAFHRDLPATTNFQLPFPAIHKWLASIDADPEHQKGHHSYLSYTDVLGKKGLDRLDRIVADGTKLNLAACKELDIDVGVVALLLFYAGQDLKTIQSGGDLHILHAPPVLNSPPTTNFPQ